MACGISQQSAVQEQRGAISVGSKVTITGSTAGPPCHFRPYPGMWHLETQQKNWPLLFGYVFPSGGKTVKFNPTAETLKGLEKHLGQILHRIWKSTAL